MAKGAATEEKLANLHNVLADALIAGVSEQKTVLDEETGEEATYYVANPALLTVAIKFLKDNDITCQPSEENKTGRLKQELEERKKNRLANVIPIREVEHG